MVVHKSESLRRMNGPVWEAASRCAACLLLTFDQTVNLSSPIIHVLRIFWSHLFRSKHEDGFLYMELKEEDEVEEMKLSPAQSITET